MWRKMVAQIGLKKRGLKKRGSITSGYKTCFWFDKMWFHDNGFVKMWFQKSWVDSTWLTWFEKCVSISMMFEKMISRTHAGKHVQFFSSCSHQKQHPDSKTKRFAILSKVFKPHGPISFRQLSKKDKFENESRPKSCRPYQPTLGLQKFIHEIAAPQANDSNNGI